MLYASTKHVSCPVADIHVELKKTNFLRECEMSIRDTGVKVVFTVVEYDKRDNLITFKYEGMPLVSFAVDDLGHENVSKIIAFMNKNSQTITYRTETKG